MNNSESNSGRTADNNGGIYNGLSHQNISVMGVHQPVVETHNKDEWVHDLIGEINKLQPKIANVICQRVGLDKDGGRLEPKTLESIGSDLGLTRERVRQIESRALAHMGLNSVWSEKFKPGVEWLMTESDTGSRSLKDLEQHEPWFKGASEKHEIMAYLLAQSIFSGKKIHLVEFNEQFYVSPLNKMDVANVIKKSVKSLESGVNNRWTEEEALGSLDKIIPKKIGYLIDVIWSDISKQAHFVYILGDETQPKRLVSIGKSAEAMSMKSLSESPTPLHYSILPALLGQTGFEVNERRIHAAANAVAYIYGQGVYGVIEHHPFTIGQRKQLHDLALKLVKSKEINDSALDSKQWSCLDLIALFKENLAEVFAILGNEAEKLDQYLLNIALSEGSGFVYVGRNLWRMAIAGEKNKPRDVHGFIGRSGRINIKDSLEQLITEAGKPVSSKAIKDKLNEKRSVTQVPYHRAFNGDLIKVDEDMWGLLGRDIVISEHEIKQWEREASKVMANHPEGMDAHNLWEKTRDTVSNGSVNNIYVFMSLLARAGLVKWRALNQVGIHH